MLSCTPIPPDPIAAMEQIQDMVVNAVRHGNGGDLERVLYQASIVFGYGPDQIPTEGERNDGEVGSSHTVGYSGGWCWRLADDEGLGSDEGSESDEGLGSDEGSESDEGLGSDEGSEWGYSSEDAVQSQAETPLRGT